MLAYSAPVRQTLETDVLVVGGGSAGAAAAVAAAMQGVSVTLVERYGFLGGIGTQALDSFCGFYTPGDAPVKVVGGIPDRVVEELERRDRVLYRTSAYGNIRVITYNPEALKVVWESLAREAGVRVLYHTLVVDAIQDGDRVAGAIAVNKGGFVALRAGAVIDASGDADLAAAAGAPFESAADGPAQALTTTFRLLNVDVARAQEVSADQLHALMAEAMQHGDHDLPRAGGSFNLTPLPGVVTVNMARVSGVDATDPLQLAEAETEGRRQAVAYCRFLKACVPGFEAAALASLSVQTGVRESRRILGAYRLTRADVLAARRFDDAVARCGWPIEDHRAGDATHLERLAEGDAYDIPYRCLVPQQVEGLLVAGRCFSADHAAHASARVMAQCMAMGQAAGVAAAMATQAGVTPREAPVGPLQDRLRAMGAVI